MLPYTVTDVVSNVSMPRMGRHGVFRQVAGYQPALDRGLREQAVVQRDVVLQLVEAQPRASTGDEVLGFAVGNAVDLVEVGIGVVATHERPAFVGGGNPAGLSADRQIHPLAVFEAQDLARIFDVKGDVTHITRRGEVQGEFVAVRVILLQVAELADAAVTLGS
ncbi:hypothetical protein J3A98_002517 [Pseudomonas sp. BP6]|nr:hypothetical protein [Pseudomonas sp. BP6]MBP2289205.1 hypothetical protein [Pseudomonas sp. BP7]